MSKNRFMVVPVVMSILLVTMAVLNPGSSAQLASNHTASDFYQRHPDWRSNVENAVVPVTGSSESADYFQRHPELSFPALMTVDTTDYFTRHPELHTPTTSNNLSDYFLRH